MKTENVVLMRQAREALKGKWGLAIGVTVVYMIILVSVDIPVRIFMYQFFTLRLGFAGLILGGPMALGMAIFSLAVSRKQDSRFGQLFDGFRRFGDALVTYLLACLYILLWFLLLIVPGIIAAISYSQIFFILADDENIRPSEAIDKSKKMMDGYKLKFFYLCLRFIGLSMLCVLTLGIGFFWLMPYINITYAKFYEDIKGEQPVDFSDHLVA